MGANSAKTAIGKGVTPEQLAEAERGAKLMLARHFSAVWIARNVRDLLGQANIEYAEWLKENQPARNPVGWLLNCVYWRAQNVRETESRRPPTASLDAVFHLEDESTPDPEQQALDHDRQRRLREALGHLPEKERKLISLVYFEDYSIREAGRKLGWQKSAADRHHKAAMEKMLALVGDRSLLSPAILGPAAWAVVNGEGRHALGGAWDAAVAPAREGLAFAAEALEKGAHRLADLARRLPPFADAGNAAAAGGGGRALGYCGAAAGVLVCGLVGSGAIGPGVGEVLHDSVRTQRHQARQARSVPPAPIEPSTLPAPELPLPTRDRSSEGTRSAGAAQPADQRKRPSRFRFPEATGKQSASEFGDNNFGSGSSTESSAPAEAPAEPAPAPSSGSSGSQSSGSQATSEFGL
jgi:RNA polymerase sigma factor (sigma-70 family)